LQYKLDIAENVLKTQIPRFLLQPIVENAIKYGGYGLRSIKKKLKLLYPNAHEIHFLNKPVKQVHIILETAKNH